MDGEEKNKEMLNFSVIYRFPVMYPDAKAVVMSFVSIRLKFRC